jgi:hypothetical protein
MLLFKNCVVLCSVYIIEQNYIISIVPPLIQAIIISDLDYYNILDNLSISNLSIHSLLFILAARLYHSVLKTP